MRSFTAAVAAATATAIVVSSSFVIAAIPDATTKVISGCYNKKSGELRVIDKKTKAACKRKDETPISWNQQGEKGEPGSSGMPGAVGAQGPVGEPGSMSCENELIVKRSIPDFILTPKCVPPPPPTTTAPPTTSTIAPPPPPPPPSGPGENVTAACSNTFFAHKLAVEYNIVASASSNPIAPNSTFAVDFYVTARVPAEQLNQIYDALTNAGQALSAIPITQASATIIPLTGATGPAVTASLAANFVFVIPKPVVVPVTASVSIPLGFIHGTYTANAAGDVSFAISGNAYSPTIPAVVGPPAVAAIPADQTPFSPPVYGWTAAKAPPPIPARPTTAGLETFTKLSLINGIVTPYNVCMGGSWTQYPATTPGGSPTYDFPLIPPVGFARFPIS